jgi:hypothetical protein
MQEVLALVCCYTDVETLCAALCVSKAATTAILGTCCGHSNSTVAFSFDLFPISRLSQQAFWLSKYGSLVAELEVDAANIAGEEEAVSYELIACLAVRPPLQVHCLSIKYCTYLINLLQAVDARQLRSLDINTDIVEGPHASPLFPAVLRRLTALQSLTLSYNGGDEQQLQGGTTAALASLEHLTSLQLGRHDLVLPLSGYKQLPPGLQSLVLFRVPPGFRIDQLQQLKLLKLIQPRCTGTDLLALNNLTGLKELKIWEYYRTSTPQPLLGRVRVFPRLCSLRSLSIWDCERLDEGIAAGIRGSTALTCLGLIGDYNPVLVTADLAAMLRPLQQLRELTLDFGGYEVPALPASLPHCSSSPQTPTTLKSRPTTRPSREASRISPHVQWGKVFKNPITWGPAI